LGIKRKYCWAMLIIIIGLSVVFRVIGPRLKEKRPNYEIEQELRTNANPLRYAALSSVYPSLERVADEMIDGNTNTYCKPAIAGGLIKFYFDVKIGS
jgi:hypothetical protein